MQEHAFTAIVLSGQRPGIDPLAAHFGQDFKALIEVAGEPMLSRVAHTLAARKDVARIIVLAQQAASLLDHPKTLWMKGDARIEPRDCGSSVVQAIIDTLAANPDGYPFLLTTADNVLLTNEMIDAYLAQVSGYDLGAALVGRQVLLAAYPGNKRTWLPFRSGAYSGANLFWLGSVEANKGLDVWRGIEQQRKKARAVLGAFGYGLALMIGLRLLTLDQAVVRVGKRLKLRAKAVSLPFAEACIDVDKPSDHEMAEAILRKRN